MIIQIIRKNKILERELVSFHDALSVDTVQNGWFCKNPCQLVGLFFLPTMDSLKPPLRLPPRWQIYPPRSHCKTTQLPVEIAEGSISIAAGAYQTAGDVSMIDS